MIKCFTSRFFWYVFYYVNFATTITRNNFTYASATIWASAYTFIAHFSLLLSTKDNMRLIVFAHIILCLFYYFFSVATYIHYIIGFSNCNIFVSLFYNNLYLFLISDFSYFFLFYLHLHYTILCDIILWTLPFFLLSYFVYFYTLCI